MDGNFRVAPDEFTQLYVIRCPNGDSTVTCVYALLQDKTRQTYEDVFNAIVDRCAVLQLQPPAPTNVHCDFEAAVHQAVRVVFPAATINGCFYHLTQVNKRNLLSTPEDLDYAMVWL